MILAHCTLPLMNFRSEVERIIYEKRLAYTYRPVFNCDKLKVMGFLARATPLNTSFASIEELKNYAVRAKDDKNLFAAIAKNLVPRFVNERDNKTQKLFYPVRMASIIEEANDKNHSSASERAKYERMKMDKQKAKRKVVMTMGRTSILELRTSRAKRTRS